MPEDQGPVDVDKELRNILDRVVYLYQRSTQSHGVLRAKRSALLSISAVNRWAKDFTPTRLGALVLEGIAKASVEDKAEIARLRAGERAADVEIERLRGEVRLWQRLVGDHEATIEKVKTELERARVAYTAIIEQKQREGLGPGCPALGVCAGCPRAKVNEDGQKMALVFEQERAKERSDDQ